MKEILSKLPKQTWFEVCELYQWQGSWYFAPHLEAMFTAQLLFEARDDDIIIATLPKTGTTWLKSLIPYIVEGSKYEDDDDDPFLKDSPQFVVKTLEINVFRGNQNPDLSMQDCLLSLARNPKDVFVSSWHFMNKVMRPMESPYPIEKAFESFCNGVQIFGPYFDHVLKYWNESLKVREKILFLKYEEMKRNPKGEVEKLASFIGRPFANNVEIENVLQKSSFERLKNLDVNKTGFVRHGGPPNSSFFRLGTIGDWKNYFTPDMQERLDHIATLKLEGSGLDLDI
ncbi:hypothetical protein AQUCO_07900002v1 [Aquilegia coerulea]|uniref:Sulfotransferase n=1 Tax=Aquilegia coerulea TaxID=218851 RepID=A0A2G5C7T3_AQUCA|nr:hypothetical protein AQUCO_07900002v1 [Aquilegia coerulea]